MKTLADRLLDVLAEFPRGPTVAEAAKRLAADPAFIRKAFTRLDSEGRAVMVRRRGGRAFYLVPLGYPILACKHCHVEFERPPQSKRQCCSRSCGIAWSWTLPGVREKRRTGINEERKSPKAKQRIARLNRRRWSDPKQHELLSEQNWRMWRDPVAKAKRSASIQAINGSAEKRKKSSELKRKQWADPQYREKYALAMRRRSRLFAHQGQMLTLDDLERMSGINRRTLYGRLVQKKMSVEQALRPTDLRFKR